MFMMSENLIRIIVIYQKNNNTYSILVSVPCWLQILYLYIVCIYIYFIQYIYTIQYKPSGKRKKIQDQIISYLFILLSRENNLLEKKAKNDHKERKSSQVRYYICQIFPQKNFACQEADQKNCTCKNIMFRLRKFLILNSETFQAYSLHSFSLKLNYIRIIET